MKIVQNIVAIVALGLTGAFIFQIAKMISIDNRVDDNSRALEVTADKIAGVEKQGKLHEVTLGDHGKSIEENRDRIAVQEKQLQAVKVRMDTLRGRLGELEKDAAANGQEIKDLRQQLTAFQADYDRRRKENAELREHVESLLQRDAEIELRLRALEKQRDVGTPEPAKP